MPSQDSGGPAKDPNGKDSKGNAGPRLQNKDATAKKSPLSKGGPLANVAGQIMASRSAATVSTGCAN